MLTLLRPREWIKNTFVFAPLLFAGVFTEPSLVTRAVLAFLLFCVASSAVYVLNDLRDIEEDRRHPRKSRTRPLANGALSTVIAWRLLAVLYVVVLATSPVMPAVSAVLLAYIALNVTHTLVLQRQPVVDIFSISLGFVLRVYAGAQAIAVPVSEWMFVTTLCLALYVATQKRRQELNWGAGTGRAVLQHYSAALLDSFSQIAATAALVFYSLFVMSTRPQLVYTIPLVLFGLFRYSWLVSSRAAGESPAETLLDDWQLLGTVLAWLGLCAWSIGSVAL